MDDLAGDGFCVTSKVGVNRANGYFRFYSYSLDKDLSSVPPIVMTFEEQTQ
jgi:hypothetical protein